MIPFLDFLIFLIMTYLITSFFVTILAPFRYHVVKVPMILKDPLITNDLIIANIFFIWKLEKIVKLINANTILNK